MKIVTWNINGIRAASREKSLKTVLDELNADVICLQETKVTRDQLDEMTAIVDGYNSYFSYSKVKSGYSGVANFCRDSVTPIAAEEGLSPFLTSISPIGCYSNLTDFTDGELEGLDSEGRCVMTEHKTNAGDNVVIINVYCPRAEVDNEERMNYKMRFYELLKRRSKALIENNKQVVIVGDINVSHKMIDHCDPGEKDEFESNPSRQWIDAFLLDVNKTSDEKKHTEDEKLCFVDSFRYFHPDQREAFTCWCTVTGARQTNYGTRLDYIFTTLKYLRQEFTECIIRPNFEGSDHCPVVASLKCVVVPANKPPCYCTNYMPEFAGKQQKLSMFFKAKDVVSDRLKNTLDKNSAAFEKDVKPSHLIKYAEDEVKETAGAEASTLEINSSPSFKVDDFLGSPRNYKIDSKGNCLGSDLAKRNIPKTIGTKQKRSTANSTTNGPNKRLKTCKSSEGKSLLTFFGKAKGVATSAVSSDYLQHKSINKNAIDERQEHVDTLKSSGVDKCMDSLSQSSTDSSPSCSQETQYLPQNDQSIQHLQNDQSTYHSQKDQTRHNKVSEGVKSRAAQWKDIFKGPPPVPLCPGHKEACVTRTVKNKGPNHGKQFFCCARGEGHSSNPEARCNFFKWVSK